MTFKTYTRQFEITGTIRLRAESPEEAQKQIDRMDKDEIAREYGLLNTEEFPLIEHPDETEGLSRLKASELVRI